MPIYNIIVIHMVGQDAWLDCKCKQSLIKWDTFITPIGLQPCLVCEAPTLSLTIRKSRDLKNYSRIVTPS